MPRFSINFKPAVPFLAHVFTAADSTCEGLLGLALHGLHGFRVYGLGFRFRVA